MAHRLHLNVLIGAILSIVSSIASAQTSAPASQTSPLQIHVSAVIGGAQFRDADTPHWTHVTAGMDLPEGVEFRTGPKGAVQFTVGTDQVFRVDRLSIVKVLRASLMPDGTIHTDVGLSYGRVSKDVDTPQRPHADTIVSPSSTLAVRGTRVSLYDQPPYDPEAVSLTGAAVYTNIKGLAVAFGTHGGGTNKVVGTDNSAAQTALDATQVDPTSVFAGRSESEAVQQFLLQTSGVPALQDLPGVLGLGFSQSHTASIGVGPAVVGTLAFTLGWTGSPFSSVELSFTDAAGVTISMPTVGTISNNGVFLQAASTPNASGSGGQAGGYSINFPVGEYTFRETLVAGQKASAILGIAQNLGMDNATLLGLFNDQLTASNPQVVHQVDVPPPPPPATPMVLRASMPSRFDSPLRNRQVR